MLLASDVSFGSVVWRGWGGEGVMNHKSRHWGGHANTQRYAPGTHKQTKLGDTKYTNKKFKIRTGRKCASHRVTEMAYQTKHSQRYVWATPDRRFCGCERRKTCL